MLLAPLLLATALHVGAPMPVADLQPGDPATWDRVLATWNEPDGLHAAVARTSQRRYQLVNMRIRDDGTADPAALRSYPTTDQYPGIAPIGNDLMFAWYTFGDDTVTVQRLGHDGTPRTAATRVPNGGMTHLVCSDSTCFLGGGSGVFIDANGSVIADPRGQRLDAIIASAVGFLTYDVVAKTLSVRDRQGAITKTIPMSDQLDDLSYDGARYLVATQKVYSDSTVIYEIDPVSGFTTTKTMLLGPYLDQVRLTWNGTQYLLLFDTAFGNAVMRLDASLRPIDPAAKGVFIPSHDVPVIAGTESGFWILFQPANSLRATFVRNDGTIVPATHPVITDRAGQMPVTAASSRSAILGIRSEGSDVFAARIDRDGHPLDDAPIAIGQPKNGVRAASDGDGFLVVWDRNAMRIDATGRTTRFALPISTPMQSPSLEFLNGAYQVAFFINLDCTARGLTITTTGTVTQVDSVQADCNVAGPVAFDGRHLIAMWPLQNHLHSATHDLVTGVSTSRDLLDYTGHFPPALGAARDGDSLIVFYSLNDGLATDVMLNRLTTDGRFALEHSVMVSPQDAETILRIGGTWFVNGARLTPFNPVTFAPGTPIEPLGNLVPGWNGEALSIGLRNVAITSGWTTQMVISTVNNTTPSHGRAAGK